MLAAPESVRVGIAQMVGDSKSLLGSSNAQRHPMLFHPIHANPAMLLGYCSGSASITMCASIGPWTPTTSVCSMSAVRLGPLMRLR